MGEREKLLTKPLSPFDRSVCKNIREWKVNLTLVKVGLGQVFYQWERYKKQIKA